LENDTFEAFSDYCLKPIPNRGEMEIEKHTPIQVPFGSKAIGSRWVYRMKQNPDGTTRYKVRLVVKGLEINRNEDGISLSQGFYIDTLLKWFCMEDSRNVLNPLDPNVQLENEECEDNPADRNLYLSLVGSLMYAALGSRPDISFAVSSLSRYNSTPLTIHLTAAK
jgi:hypothetical protein